MLANRRSGAGQVAGGGLCRMAGRPIHRNRGLRDAGEVVDLLGGVQLELGIAEDQPRPPYSSGW